MELILKSAQEQFSLLEERLSLASKGSLIFGVHLLDDLIHGFLPGELTLLYGSPSSYLFADYLIVRSLLSFNRDDVGSDIIYIDGGNRFNLYRIVDFARKFGLQAKESLRHIHVSRAFTSHQLTTLVTRELKRELKRHPSQLVVVSDILSILQDEETEAEEARTMLNLLIRSLRDITCEKALITLLPHSKLIQNVKQRGVEVILWPKADIILHLHELRKRTRILCEKHPTETGLIDFDLKSLQFQAD